MFKAVIFDMDGVIIDSEPYHFQFEKNFFNQLGLNISREKHLSFMGMNNTLMWTLIKNEYNLNEPLKTLLEKDKINRLIFFDNLKKLPIINSIEDILKKIKTAGIKTGLASSSDLELINLILKKSKLQSFFNQVVSGEFVEKGKPAPDIFLKTACLLKVKARDCLVIEDSTNGVKAAKAAGMYCIGFNNPNSHGQNLQIADEEINSISEINLQNI